MIRRLLSTAPWRPPVKRARLADLKRDDPGEKTRVRGWLRSYSQDGSTLMLNINDGSSARDLRVAVSVRRYDDGASKTLNHLRRGCLVEVIGRVDEGAERVYSITTRSADALKVVGSVASKANELPEPADVDAYALRDEVAHFRPRLENKFAAILRLRSIAELHLRRELIEKKHFTCVSAPCFSRARALKTNMCVALSRTFADEVYFTKTSIDEVTPVFLPSTARHHVEALCRSIGDVFAIGRYPVNAHAKTFDQHAMFPYTNRALGTPTERTMLEFEILGDMSMAMDLVEELVRTYHTTAVTMEHGVFAHTAPSLDPAPFERITEADLIAEYNQTSKKVISNPTLNCLKAHSKLPFFVTLSRHGADAHTRTARRENETYKPYTFHLVLPSPDMPKAVCVGGARTDAVVEFADEWRNSLATTPRTEVAGCSVDLDVLTAWCVGERDVRDVVTFPRWMAASLKC